MQGVPPPPPFDHHRLPPGPGRDSSGAPSADVAEPDTEVAAAVQQLLGQLPGGPDRDAVIRGLLLLREHAKGQFEHAIRHHRSRMLSVDQALEPMPRPADFGLPRVEKMLTLLGAGPGFGTGSAAYRSMFSSAC